MHYLLLLLSIVTLSLFADDSSMQISPRECLKARYSNTFGGTMLSRSRMHNKLEKKSEAQLPHTAEEALKKIQSTYKTLQIKKIEFIIRNCKGYYLGRSQNAHYYFDPITLKLIQNRGRKQ